MAGRKSPYRILSRQAATRFAAVFLIIGGVSAGLFWLAWHFANHSLAMEQARNNTAAIRYKLDGRIAEWQRAGESLATEITFHRMLDEAGDERWIKLRAFMTALGESFGFDSLAIVDRRGDLVFSLGQEAGPPSALTGAMRESRWFINREQRRLYRVVRAPLWLGLDGGRGELILLKCLDNPQIARLASPGIRLHLAIDDEIYASSGVDTAPGGRVDVVPRGIQPRAGGKLIGDLELGDPASRLRIEHILPQAVSPMQFALAGVALTATLALALYLVFGDWLRNTVRRTEALSRAATLFAGRHRIDREIGAVLDEAAGQHDEVDVLRTSLHALMQASQERDEESRAYLRTLDILEEAVVEADQQGRLLRHSPAWTKLMGADCASRNLFDCFDPEDGEELREQIALLFSGAKDQVTARLRSSSPRRDGTWMECRFVPSDQPVTRIQGVLRDVTQTYLQEKHVTHMALHDGLTGLPNRLLLEDRIKVAVRRAQRDGARVGIGFIDLDHFKHINDELGHKVGDLLLIAFSDHLRNTLRTGDTLARWGGDEFVVLLPDMPSLGEIRLVADKLAKASRKPVEIKDLTLPVTFSMGFAVYPEDGENVDALLSQADQAMFHAKSLGRNSVRFFSDMTRKGLGNLRIQNKLTTAIHDGLIETWFQPVVDANSHRVVGLEALARWHDEDLGWISPATFIPMAESLGLMGTLSGLVVSRTLTMGHRLMEAGHDLRLAVNISKRQLFLADFADHLLAEAAGAGVEPGRITLEITEGIAMSEADYAGDRLRALHGAGFRLAADDFGAGYGSLSPLHDMPVDELKIDMFLTRRARDPRGARPIRAIVAMARALRLTTVAKGVEDRETATLLTDMGVDSLQGYHFGRPMLAAEFEHWLDATNR